MRAVGTLLFFLGICVGLLAAFVLFAAWSDFGARGCPGAVQCSDAVSVMVMAGCTLIASGVMIFAAVVLARR